MLLETLTAKLHDASPQPALMWPSTNAYTHLECGIVFCMSSFRRSGPFDDTNDLISWTMLCSIPLTIFKFPFLTNERASRGVAWRVAWLVRDSSRIRIFQKIGGGVCALVSRAYTLEVIDCVSGSAMLGICCAMKLFSVLRSQEERSQHTGTAGLVSWYT